MKKIKLDSSKLQLKKEKISSLNTQEMEAIQGGNAAYPPLTNTRLCGSNMGYCTVFCETASCTCFTMDYPCGNA